MSTQIKIKEIEDLLEHISNFRQYEIGDHPYLCDNLNKAFRVIHSGENSGLDNIKLNFYASKHPLTPNEYIRSQEIVTTIVANEHKINHIAYMLSADVEVYDLGDDDHLTASDITKAITYGMLSVEEHHSAVFVDSVSIGQNLTALNIIEQIEKGQSDILKIKNISADLAAMVGSMIAAKMRNIPVLITSPIGLCACILLGLINKDANDNVLYISNDDSLLYVSAHHQIANLKIKSQNQLPMEMQALHCLVQLKSII